MAPVTTEGPLSGASLTQFTITVAVVRKGSASCLQLYTRIYTAGAKCTFRVDTRKVKWRLRFELIAKLYKYQFQGRENFNVFYKINGA